MNRKITFYKKATGECPIETWLNKLSAKEDQKISWVLKLIRELDIVPEQYLKKLSGTKDIWECRIQLSPNVYRIFSFFWKEGNSLVLTHGYIKKTQKTDKIEIERAERYKEDWLARN